jgi:hypothetical protein
MPLYVLLIEADTLGGVTRVPVCKQRGFSVLGTLRAVFLTGNSWVLEGRQIRSCVSDNVYEPRIDIGVDRLPPSAPLYRRLFEAKPFPQYVIATYTEKSTGYALEVNKSRVRQVCVWCKLRCSGEQSMRDRAYKTGYGGVSHPGGGP